MFAKICQDVLIVYKKHALVSPGKRCGKVNVLATLFHNPGEKYIKSCSTVMLTIHSERSTVVFNYSVNHCKP